MFTAIHLLRQNGILFNRPLVQSNSLSGWIKRGTLDATILSSGYFFYQVKIRKEPKLQETWMRLTRPVYFWSHLFPIYVHYRFTELLVKNQSEENQTKAFNQLHERYAPVVLNTILHLRGLFIKIGQVGTTRADFVPEAYRKALHTLLDNVPTPPVEEVIAILESSLGQKLHEVFDTFNPIPIGAASIGQVHSATLKDGKEVVVKIQYPMVEKLFDSDFATGRAFCQLAQPEMIPLFNELEKQFKLEFDFSREAWALNEVHKNITPYFPNVCIPQPVSQLCTRHVLVMNRIPGEKLVDAVIHHYQAFAEHLNLSVDALKTVSKWTLYRKLIPLYVYQSSYWGMVWVWNHTFGYLIKTWEYPNVLNHLNGQNLLETIIRVHGHELLIDGLFNGDPHPGNILLFFQHHRPRIGLIDYGQVKELTRQQRIHLSQLILALNKNDVQQVVQLMIQLGFKSVHMDPEVLYKNAVIGFDRDDKEVTEGYNFQQYTEMLEQKDKLLVLPDWLVMPMRLSVLLRGLGTLLCPESPIRMSQYWAEIAEKVIKTASPEELLRI